MAQAPATTATPRQLRLIIRGRVAAVTQRDSAGAISYRTLINTPAADQYSHPSTFEIRSKRRIGARGEEIEVECDLLGYARSYDGKDGSTVRTAEHVLQQAEAA